MRYFSVWRCVMFKTINSCTLNWNPPKMKYNPFSIILNTKVNPNFAGVFIGILSGCIILLPLFGPSFFRHYFAPLPAGVSATELLAPLLYWGIILLILGIVLEAEVVFHNSSYGSFLKLGELFHILFASFLASTVLITILCSPFWIIAFVEWVLLRNPSSALEVLSLTEFGIWLLPISYVIKIMLQETRTSGQTYGGLNQAIKSTNDLPISGYRRWDVKNNRLYPITSAAIYRSWEREGSQAKCGSISHHHTEIPGVNCTCGFYSYKTLKAQRKGEKENPFLTIIRPLRLHFGYEVKGITIAWGTVVLHKDGWRAEYAKPIALIYSWINKRKVLAISKSSGLPAVSYRKAELFATEFADKHSKW